MDGADAGDDSAWSTFADFLESSSRVLCLVGAGLSAPSGLTTWRGTNGLWNDINLRELASPNKFQEDPVTVWSFYGERLLKSLEAQPNAAHHALAALAIEVATGSCTLPPRARFPVHASRTSKKYTFT
ncbi:DHS-like NAD/FAD-binding domain-containing protein [Mytilinidion resinicola]|uniref:DHS-like NAD/FAD-binding domain-containing protein n=1 Tax=Mytilinidion resinicola TaxID=574789 RepID=A0A6A6YMP4_9PEZI|nr:DHS-like NAD/FAD-binding domain-containing protein [Mytilinidion resinicola]KAF2809137.1 DHS-like NAD/FAD-binding domain-containing protein [Mytilinidion resinicola]